MKGLNMGDIRFQKRQLLKFKIGIVYGALIQWINKWISELILYWIFGSVIALGVYYTGPLSNINFTHHIELTFRWFAILLLFRVGYKLEWAVNYRKHGLEYSRSKCFDEYFVTPVLKLVVIHSDGVETVYYIGEELVYERFVEEQVREGVYLTEMRIKTYDDIQFFNQFITSNMQSKTQSLFDPEMRVG